MGDPIYQFPDDTAPIREWARPLSGHVTPLRCMDDTRGREDIGTMSPGEIIETMRACRARKIPLAVTAAIIGKTPDATTYLAQKLGLIPWKYRDREARE